MYRFWVGLQVQNRAAQFNGASKSPLNGVKSLPRLQKIGQMGDLDDPSPSGTDPDANRAADSLAHRVRDAVESGGGPAAVARRSGIPYGSIQHYRQGRGMKPADLVALADACGVSIEWLAAGRGPMRAGLKNETIPQSPGPAFFKLFGRLDMDRMGIALKTTVDAFHSAGSSSPSWRRIAQVAALIYDVLEDPDAEPDHIVKALSAATQSPEEC